uniref:Neur_chan_LBD domain-containing protein n=1 Tax=Heterorhabditis bacteriophora TaxID=37862 RepID=A0A1I7WU58_HETBA
MRSLCIVYVISYFFTSSVADECAKEQEIIKQVFFNGQGDIQPGNDNKYLSLDPSLYFSHLRPCKAYVNMLGHRGNLWIPELSFTNVDDLVLHKHSVTIQLNQDGTMVHSQS